MRCNQCGSYNPLYHFPKCNRARPGMPPPDYMVFKDGDQWCAVGKDFVDLQNSEAWFGKTPQEALARMLPTDKNQWWCVMNPYPEGHKPSMRHTDFETAKAEAQRVADKNGKKCHVLAKVFTAEPANPKWCDHASYVGNAIIFGNGGCVVFERDGKRWAFNEPGWPEYAPCCGSPRPSKKSETF